MTLHTFSPTIHVTTRSQNREKFKAPLGACWEVFCDRLYFVKHAYNLEMHSFVLMPNHYHWIFNAPENNASDAIGYFNRETSKTINRMMGQINHTWGAPAKQCIIDSYHYYLNAYKYVYYNPVKAGLIGRAEDYPYSTLYGLLGRDRIIVPLIEDTLLFEDIDKTLAWINQKPRKCDSESVRLALRHKKFHLPKIDHRPNPLEKKLL